MTSPGGVFDHGVFDLGGVTRGPDGVKRYDVLPASLVHMLRTTVEQRGAAEAVAETGGGPRLTYAELWERAERVAGGLRAHGVERGGAPISPDLVARLGRAFPQARLGNGFGLTETCSVATFLPHEFVAHADSVGFPAPVCGVRLDAVQPDGAGELLVRGPNVVAGYWNKPEATAAAFAGRWLHTGDLARIDDEGLVYLVDRIKDMINRGGENVYCVEVENALAGAPGVYEAAVLGVPDEVMGEKVGAVIVPAPGAPFDAAAVFGYLGARIADFKIPEYVAVSAVPLPRNPGGKLLKRQLRDETDWTAAIRR